MRKCCALRATMILISFYSVLAGRRPAGLYCENSGRSGGIGASARSDRAKSGVFRDRSASAGVVTRYFSLCLIFWCFWIKPKAQEKKEVKSILTFFGKVPYLRFGVSCEEQFYHLLTPKGGAKSVRRAKKSGNGRRLAPKTLRGRARARVFDGASFVRSSSRFFAMRRQLCAARNDDYLLASVHGKPRPAGSHREKSG